MGRRGLIILVAVLVALFGFARHSSDPPASTSGQDPPAFGSSGSVTALEPCLAIEVPRRAFELWMKKPGTFRNTMDRTYIERGLANHLRMRRKFRVDRE